MTRRDTSLSLPQTVTLQALRKLEIGYHAHASGGFDLDDIHTHIIGFAGRPSDLLDTIYSLGDKGLVECIEAPMGDDAWPTHWRSCKETWVLSEQQLGGFACVVCAGAGGTLGMCPVGLETKTSSEVFRCVSCPSPAKETVQRLIKNSGAALESGVVA